MKIDRHKIRAVAIPIAVLLCVLSFWLPTMTSIAAILLLYVTFEYVLLTEQNLDLAQENLALFRTHLQREERVVLHYDLGIKDKSLNLRVSNLGLSNFLLQKIYVRKPDKTGFLYDVHKVIESGKTQETSLPAELYREQAFGVDLEVTLEYLGLDGRGKTSPKCFNVFLGMHDTPVEIKPGLDDFFWSARCGKCNDIFITNVDGLQTFEAAQARTNELIKDIGASCPNHHSQWLLTVDHVQAQKHERRNRQALS